MARKRKRKSRGLQPAVTTLYFQADTATAGDSRSYVDTAKELSKVNRRLYEQGRLYAYQGLTFIWRQSASSPLASLECTVRTAGNTWMVHNAFVKGEALWHQMQELVLEDNPSIKGKWHDFKVQLWEGQSTARQLNAKDAAGTDYKAGEWNISTYVMPQHDVNPTSGEPLAATELSAMLIGDDTTTKRSLLKAYEESRATVQADMPNVPAGVTDSFFNLLTDTGSQEPELATVIIDENDNPPYDLDEYPGAATNAPTPVAVQFGATSTAEVDGNVGAFVAPCGLVEIELVGYDATGVQVATADMPIIDLLLHVAPGMYKGVAAVPMGQ